LPTRYFASILGRLPPLVASVNLSRRAMASFCALTTKSARLRESASASGKEKSTGGDGSVEGGAGADMLGRVAEGGW
jgi:hypothetical protein